MYERFTDRCKVVMALANAEAKRRNHGGICPEHILLGLLKEGKGVGANVLKNLRVDFDRVNLEIDQALVSGSVSATADKLPQTPPAKKVIQYAIEESRGLNHNYVGTEHLLLGMLRVTDSLPAKILMSLGVSLDAARFEVVELLGQGVKADDPATDAGTPPFEEWFAITYPGASEESRKAAVIAWNAAIHAVDEQLSRIKDQMVRDGEYGHAAVVRDAKEAINRSVRIAR